MKYNSSKNSFFKRTMFITGFGPFRNITDNPSFETVKHFVQDHCKVILANDVFVIKEWIKLIHFYGPGRIVYIHSMDDKIKQLFDALDVTDNREKANMEIFFEFTSLSLPSILPISCAVSYEYVQKITEFYWTHDFKYCIHVGVGLPGQFKLELLGNINYNKPDIYATLPKVVPKRALHTVLPIPQVFEALKSKYNVALSTDAGAYVCDYTLAISNHYSNRRSLFIHVPSDGKVPEMIAFVQDVISILNSLV